MANMVGGLPKGALRKKCAYTSCIYIKRGAGARLGAEGHKPNRSKAYSVNTDKR
jgi:hypothetical protein